MNFAPKPAEPLNASINILLDAALAAENAKQKPRPYLGGSRLGVECLRALAFEWFAQRSGKVQTFGGRALRRFALGHMQETETARWLRLAGFDLKTADPEGHQFGFAVAKDEATGEYQMRGHIDGAIVDGPIALPYPLLWEHKIMNAKKWKTFTDKGVVVSHPVYWGQIHVYMGYMDLAWTLFTAWNSDTSELAFELVPFNAQVAQDMTDRGVRVLEARVPQDLPRIAREPTDYRCKWCEHANECWSKIDQDAPTMATVNKPAWLAGGPK